MLPPAFHASRGYSNMIAVEVTKNTWAVDKRSWYDMDGLDPAYQLQGIFVVFSLQMVLGNSCINIAHDSEKLINKTVGFMLLR